MARDVGSRKYSTQPTRSRHRLRTLSQRALHQHAVEPAAELEADIVEGADQAEACGTVQLDRARIGGIPDDRDHLAEAALLRCDDQLLEQRAADSPTLRLRRDIDRVLDTPMIGRPVAI